jgi:hypothetical protein
MKLITLLSVSSLITFGTPLYLHKRDADFLSVRRKQQKDMSGRFGDPQEKYFRE